MNVSIYSWLRGSHTAIHKSKIYRINYSVNVVEPNLAWTMQYRSWSLLFKSRWHLLIFESPESIFVCLGGTWKYIGYWVQATWLSVSMFLVFILPCFQCSCFPLPHFLQETCLNWSCRAFITHSFLNVFVFIKNM